MAASSTNETQAAQPESKGSRPISRNTSAIMLTTHRRCRLMILWSLMLCMISSLESVSARGCTEVGACPDDSWTKAGNRCYKSNGLIGSYQVNPTAETFNTFNGIWITCSLLYEGATAPSITSKEEAAAAMEATGGTNRSFWLAISDDDDNTWSWNDGLGTDDTAYGLSNLTILNNTDSGKDCVYFDHYDSATGVSTWKEEKCNVAMQYAVCMVCRDVKPPETTTTTPTPTTSTTTGPLTTATTVTTGPYVSTSTGPYVSTTTTLLPSSTSAAPATTTPPATTPQPTTTTTPSPSTTPYPATTTTQNPTIPTTSSHFTTTTILPSTTGGQGEEVTSSVAQSLTTSMRLGDHSSSSTSRSEISTGDVTTVQGTTTSLQSAAASDDPVRTTTEAGAALQTTAVEQEQTTTGEQTSKAVRTSTAMTTTTIAQPTTSTTPAPITTELKVVVTDPPALTPSPGLFVATAAPSACSASGGRVIVLSFNSFTSDIPIPSTVRFHDGQAGITLTQSSAGFFSATCATTNFTGSTNGVVLNSEGQEWAQFSFLVTAKMPVLSPTILSTGGGAVDLIVYELGTALPDSCKLLFGETEASIESRTSHDGGVRLKAAVPAVSSSGIVSATLSCYGALEAFLEFVEFSSLSKVVIQDGNCVIRSECSVSIEVKSPPSAAQNLEDFSISVVGPTVLRGLLRANLDQINSQSMTLTLNLPAYSEPGLVAVAVSPVIAPSGFTTSDFEVNFNLTLSEPNLVIVRVTPSIGTTAGGTVLTLDATGFRPDVQVTELAVRFGGVNAAAVSAILADEDGTRLSITMPPLSGGEVDLQLSDASGSRIVATPLLVTSAGYTAVCSKQCDVALRTRSIAEVVVSGFPSTTQAASFAATVNGLPAGVNSVSSSGGSFLMKLNLPVLNTTSVSVLGAALQVSLVSDSSLVAMGVINYWRHPVATRAEFNEDGSKILVHFDQATNGVGLVECADIFASESLLLLGSGPSCLWADPAMLSIQLGAAANALPNVDMLSLLGTGIQSMNLVSGEAERTDIVISTPDFPTLPELLIRGAPAIGTCDTAILLTETSSARPMTYTWSCRNDVELSESLSTNTGPSVEVNGDGLSVGKIYIITVQAVNFLGAISSTVEHEIEIKAKPPPIISMLMQPPPYIRNSKIFASFDAKPSSCVQLQAIEVQWFVSKGEEFNEAQIVYKAEGADLEIPSATLEAGQQYNVYLVLSTPEGSVEATDSRTIQVSSADLVAKILGGERTVFRQNSGVVLDGSNSYDPDVCEPTDVTASAAACADGMLYEWSCQTADSTPCRSASDLSVATFSSNSQATINMAALSLAASSFVTFTLVVSKGSRSSASTVRLNLSAQEVLPVQLRVVQDSVFRFSVQGSSSTDSLGTYEWSIDGPGYNESKADSLSLFPNGLSQDKMIINLESTLAAAVFIPGAQYSVKLRISTASLEGSASVPFSIAIPPFGGTCTLSTSNGTALLDEFTFSCLDWTAEDLPLQFRFGSLPGEFDRDSVSWTPYGYTGSYSFRLVAGSHSVAAEIADFNGISSISPISKVFAAELSIGSDGNVTVGSGLFDVVENVVNSLEALGQLTQMLQMGDSMVADFQNDIAGGARRLLASSAAYRMRVRRMMVRKAADGTGTSIPPRRLTQMLSSTQGLSSQPEEITNQTTSTTANLLESLALSASSESLRGGGLQNAMGICNSLVIASLFQPTQTQRDASMVKVVDSLTILSQIAAADMLVGEPTLTVTRDRATLKAERLPPGLSNHFETTADNLPIVVTFSSGRRALTSEDAAVVVMSFGRNWSVEGDTRSGSHSVSGVRVLDKATLEAASENVRIQKAECPGGSFCISLTTAIILPNATTDLVRAAQGRGVSCQVYDRNLFQWSNEPCTLGQIAVDRLNHIANIECKCNRDGFIKAAYTGMESETFRVITGPKQEKIMVANGTAMLLCIGYGLFIGLLASLSLRPIFITINTYQEWWTLRDALFGKWEIYSNGKGFLVCQRQLHKGIIPAPGFFPVIELPYEHDDDSHRADHHDHFHDLATTHHIEDQDERMMKLVQYFEKLHDDHETVHAAAEIIEKGYEMIQADEYYTEWATAPSNWFHIDPEEEKIEAVSRNVPIVMETQHTPRVETAVPYNVQTYMRDPQGGLLEHSLRGPMPNTPLISMEAIPQASGILIPVFKPTLLSPQHEPAAPVGRNTVLGMATGEVGFHTPPPMRYESVRAGPDDTTTKVALYPPPAAGSAFTRLPPDIIHRMNASGGGVPPSPSGRIGLEVELDPTDWITGTGSAVGDGTLQEAKA